VTWSGGAHFSASGFAKVGFFILGEGSFGRMTIAPDVRTDDVSFSTDAGHGADIFVCPPASYSSVDVDGTFPDDGRKACSEPVPVEETTWSHLKSLY